MFPPKTGFGETINLRCRDWEAARIRQYRHAGNGNRFGGAVSCQTATDTSAAFGFPAEPTKVSSQARDSAAAHRRNSLVHTGCVRVIVFVPRVGKEPEGSNWILGHLAKLRP